MSRVCAAKVLCSAAGLSVAQAAKKARIGEEYLCRLASRGKAPPHLAERLAYILGCDATVFLWGYAAHITGAIDGRRNGLQPTTPGRGVAVCGHGSVEGERLQSTSRRRHNPYLTIVD